MKKILSLGIAAAVSFAFNLNQTYSCETIGISFKKNNKVYNIPNNAKTQTKMKNSLKELYSVKIKPENKQMVIYVKDKQDTLDYVKMIKKRVALYKTKASDLFILSDAKSSQIGINIPSQKMIIYYQCK